MNNQILVTKTGLFKLKSELESLVSTKRPQLVERLSLARSTGDLSENSDYQDAKESLSFLDGQIAEIGDLIRIAKVTEPKDNKLVSFGHAVKVKVGKTEAVFEIVGEWEANPTNKKISHTSPLGKALIGKIGNK